VHFRARFFAVIGHVGPCTFGLFVPAQLLCLCLELWPLAHIPSRFDPAAVFFLQHRITTPRSLVSGPGRRHSAWRGRHGVGGGDVNVLLGATQLTVLDRLFSFTPAMQLGEGCWSLSKNVPWFLAGRSLPTDFSAHQWHPRSPVIVEAPSLAASLTGVSFRPTSSRHQ